MHNASRALCEGVYSPGPAITNVHLRMQIYRVVVATLCLVLLGDPNMEFSATRKIIYAKYKSPHDMDPREVSVCAVHI